MGCKPLRSREVVQVHEILTTICDKWTLLIGYELSHDTKRHGELQRRGADDRD
jgi:DNA-binding HxlR family transcriptional regulator